MIEKTSIVVEYVQNYVAEIDYDPSAFVHTLFSADFTAELFNLVDGVICLGSDLR